MSFPKGRDDVRSSSSPDILGDCMPVYAKPFCPRHHLILIDLGFTKFPFSLSAGRGMMTPAPQDGAHDVRGIGGKPAYQSRPNLATPSLDLHRPTARQVIREADGPGCPDGEPTLRKDGAPRCRVARGPSLSRASARCSS